MQVALNRFVLRQTPHSRFSHFDHNQLNWDKLINLIQSHIGLATPGYRDGVLEVQLPVDNSFSVAKEIINDSGLRAFEQKKTPMAMVQTGSKHWHLEVQMMEDAAQIKPLFFCPIVELSPGQILSGMFESRYGSEEPRQWMGTPMGEKLPAKFCTAILYSSELLEETQQNDHTGCWELISLNASLIEDEPMTPATLMANHFDKDGGTDDKMSDTFFVEKLAQSYQYWWNKANFVPSQKPYIVQLSFPSIRS